MENKKQQQQQQIFDQQQQQMVDRLRSTLSQLNDKEIKDCLEFRCQPCFSSHVAKVRKIKSMEWFADLADDELPSQESFLRIVAHLDRLLVVQHITDCLTTPSTEYDQWAREIAYDNLQNSRKEKGEVKLSTSLDYVLQHLPFTGEEKRLPFKFNPQGKNSILKWFKRRYPDRITVQWRPKRTLQEEVARFQSTRLLFSKARENQS